MINCNHGDYLPTKMTLQTSRRLGGSMHIGRWVLMILGPLAFSVQPTVSAVILAIMFMGSSVSTAGTGMTEVLSAVISMKGTLKKMWALEASESGLHPLATCHISSWVRVVPHLG